MILLNRRCLLTALRRLGGTEELWLDARMPEEVRAEIVASVMSVLVTAGQPVREGTALLMLESMKMEIPVISEIDGTVQDVTVAAGDVVRRGDLLVVLG